MARRRKIIALVGCSILILLAAAYYLVRPISFVFGLRDYINERETQLVFDVDHAALATEMRKFADEHRWGLGPINGKPDIFWAHDRTIPASLMVLKPSSIALFDDRVILECGGALSHFGIVVFRPGIEGSGTKKLGAGVWFFSEDGRIPRK